MRKIRLIVSLTQKIRHCFFTAGTQRVVVYGRFNGEITANIRLSLINPSPATSLVTDLLHFNPKITKCQVLLVICRLVKIKVAKFFYFCISLSISIRKLKPMCSLSTFYKCLSLSISIRELKQRLRSFGIPYSISLSISIRELKRREQYFSAGICISLSISIRELKLIRPNNTIEFV